MTRASLRDEAKIKRYGFTVERWDKGYVLRDFEGASLQIAGFGGVCPARWYAVAEALDRIDTCGYEPISGVVAA